MTDLTVAGLLGIIGLSTLLRSMMNGERMKAFVAGMEEWKRGHHERHDELERRIEKLEAHAR